MGLRTRRRVGRAHAAAGSVGRHVLCGHVQIARSEVARKDVRTDALQEATQASGRGSTFLEGAEDRLGIEEDEQPLAMVPGNPAEPAEEEQGSVELENPAVLDALGPDRQYVTEIASAEGDSVGLPQAFSLRLGVRVLLAVETHVVTPALGEAPELLESARVGAGDGDAKAELRGRIASDDDRGVVARQGGANERGKGAEQSQLLLGPAGDREGNIQRSACRKGVDVPEDRKRRSGQQRKPLADAKEAGDRPRGGGRTALEAPDGKDRASYAASIGLRPRRIAGEVTAHTSELLGSSDILLRLLLDPVVAHGLVQLTDPVGDVPLVEALVGVPRSVHYVRHEAVVGEHEEALPLVQGRGLGGAQDLLLSEAAVP